MGILQEDLKRELELMCSVRHKSMLMSASPSVLKHFTWEKLEEELKSTAPNLHSVLEGALDVHRPLCRGSQNRKNMPVKSAILGVCPCKNMAKLQTAQLANVMISYMKAVESKRDKYFRHLALLVGGTCVRSSPAWQHYFKYNHSGIM